MLGDSPTLIRDVARKPGALVIFELLMRLKRWISIVGGIERRAERGFELM